MASRRGSRRYRPRPHPARLPSLGCTYYVHTVQYVHGRSDTEQKQKQKQPCQRRQPISSDIRHALPDSHSTRSPDADQTQPTCARPPSYAYLNPLPSSPLPASLAAAAAAAAPDVAGTAAARTHAPDVTLLSQRTRCPRVFCCFARGRWSLTLTALLLSSLYATPASQHPSIPSMPTSSLDQPAQRHCRCQRLHSPPTRR